MKKFDFKKLLVLLLVVAMAVTVLAACGPKDDPKPGPGPGPGPGPDPKPTVTLADRQAEFFDTMFASADKIGKNVVDKDGNLYLELGLGLDIQIGTGDKLPLQIDIQAFVDRKNVKDANYVESDGGSYIKSGESYVKADENSSDAQRYIKRVLPKSNNATALNISIKADKVDLISLYYNVADKVDGEASGIVYAIIGGNKVKVDVSNVQADIDNVVGIVLGFVDGVLQENLVDVIVGSFGENFSLNGLLNSIISQILPDGQSLVELIEGDDTIKGIVGTLVGGMDALQDYIDDDGLDLGGLLKVLGSSEKRGKIEPLLFNAPKWSADADKATEGSIEIDLSTGGTFGGLVGGMVEFTKGATIKLGFEKEANEGNDVGKMKSFFIDAKFTGLGSSKKALAAKITINKLKISNNSNMPQVDTGAYKDLCIEIDASLNIPENFVAVVLNLDGEDMLLEVGSEDGIPTNLTLNIKGAINFADNSKTRIYGELKAGDETKAKLNLYYDTEKEYSIAEADVNSEYMKVVKAIYGLIKKGKGSEVRDFDWYEYDEEGNDLVDLVDDFGFDYTDVNSAFKIFQETGKIRLEGLNLYELIFPRDGKVWYVNFKTDSEDDEAEATAEEEEVKKAFFHELIWDKKTKGIFALIVDLIEYTDSDTRTDLKIGKNKLMKYIFGDNLFELKTGGKGDKASLNSLIAEWNMGDEETANEIIKKYSKKPDDETHTKTEISEQFAPKADGDNPTFFELGLDHVSGSGSNAIYKVRYKTYDEVLQGEAEAYWAYVFEDFNKKWISSEDEYTVKKFTIKDIEEANAFLTLWAEKTDNVFTNFGITIEINYAGKDLNLTLSAKIVESIVWEGEVGSIFTEGDLAENVGIFVLTAREPLELIED